MLNRPAVKPTATARPAMISGVARTMDSVRGRKAAWKELWRQSKIEPRIRAVKKPENARHASAKKSPGAAKKYPAAAWTPGSNMTTISAPITNARRIARAIVPADGLRTPLMKDFHHCFASLGPVSGSRVGGCGSRTAGLLTVILPFLAGRSARLCDGILIRNASHHQT